MPSGYTEKILNGCSFEEFVWAVARGFGALIMLRDDIYAPIPKKFEPSDYHFIRCEEAKNEVCRLANATKESLESEYAEYRKKFEDDRQRRVEGNANIINKYAAMKEEVLAWTPPTSDHVGLKDFMLKQIDESMRFDVVEEQYFPTFQFYEEWLTQRRAKAEKDVLYHKKEYEEECKRVKERNDWISALRESLREAK